MLSELMDQYEDLLPDLTEIGGLGLNWDSLFDCCNEDYQYPNFGMDDLYSIGDSGHDYLVFLPKAKVPVEQYPIALFSEEEGTSRIIASSIKNWFPCYLVTRVDSLLHAYNESEDADEKKAAEKALGALFADRVKVEKFTAEFGNKGFQKLLPELFDAVKAKALSSWNFAQMHRAADGGSYLDECIDAAAGKLTSASVKAFLKKHPGYAGLVPSLVAADGSAPLLDKEIALQVIGMSVTSGFGSRDDIYRILRAAAAVLRTDESYEETHFAGLVDELCDCEDPCVAHFYYEAGISFANDGDLMAALACYENAIFFSWAEEGSFHGEAFDEICYLAQEIGDKNYLAFMRSIRFEGDLDEEDEEKDDEEDDAFGGDLDGDDADEDEPEEEDDEEPEDEEDEDEAPKKQRPAPKKKR